IAGPIKRDSLKFSGRDWRNGSGQRRNHLAVFLLGEGAQSLRADVALRGNGEHELADDFIIRRFRDHDRIVLAQHQIECLDLRAHRLKGLPGPIQPGGTLLDLLDALLRKAKQSEVSGHGVFSLRLTNCYSDNVTSAASTPIGSTGWTYPRTPRRG